MCEKSLIEVRRHNMIDGYIRYMGLILHVIERIHYLAP